MSLPRLRAPREHGQILAAPPLDQVGTLLADNHHLFAANPLPYFGRSLRELQTQARHEILAVSTQYHREAGEPVPADGADAWLVAGHQPELFHPGVWFKNFALHELAKRHNGTSLNLIIDIDTAKPAYLHVPNDVRLARIEFDRSNTDTPYEERSVDEESTFAGLPRRLAPLAQGWNFEPMVGTFWDEVMKHAGRTRLLGERFAAGRRAMERRWGVVPREIPMSRVCGTRAFARFAGAILGELSLLHVRYNQAVHEYRIAHGIRSRSHPVPDLATEGDWLEAPFWAWRHGQARRGRLFARRVADRVALRAAGEDWPTLPAHPEAMAEEWSGLEARGFKIRSRALTTTMFARLFLADLFIHGIGGGLYDELTDVLIERFFKVPAPAFLVLSATLLLPLPRYPEAAANARTLQKRWRDLMYKPDRFVETNDSTEPLIRAKREWIAKVGVTRAERVERYHQIRELNARLVPWVVPDTQKIGADHREQLRRAELQEIAARRDYAFCLYPEEMLRSFFTKVIG